MSEAVIQTLDLTRKYGQQLSVNKLNLTVPKGSIYGFLGPNGAGKTTTIRMLLGLIRPTAGRVRLFDKDFPKDKLQVLGRLGSLVESPSYYGHLSGVENLEVIRKLLGVNQERIREVLSVVRLTQAASKKVKGYSLGMKQRLGIAAALLGNPDLLILDEPTNGLDPAGIQEIRELIRDLPRQHGITVVVSSHLLSEIDQMATHVGIINKGELIFQDSIDVLRRHSAPALQLYVDNSDAARDFIEKSGHKVRIEKSKGISTLKLDSLDHAATAELNALLVKNGIGVYRIQEINHSLEDIFLQLVGKGGSL